MEALLAFFATLVSLRLSADLVRVAQPRPPGCSRGRPRSARSPPASARSPGAPRPTGAIPRSASTTSSAAFSLRRCSARARCSGPASVRWVGRSLLVYVGLAIGVATRRAADPPVSGSSIPEAQAHLAFFPARLLAIAANSLGTLAAVVGRPDRPPAPAARQLADPRGPRRRSRRECARRPRQGGVRHLHRSRRARCCSTAASSCQPEVPRPVAHQRGSGRSARSAGAAP